TVTGANAIANLAYANVADKMVIDRASNLGLLVDFTLDLTFATAPVKGAIQLVAVDWSLDGTPVEGPTPSATMLPRLVSTFDPRPLASNAATSWIMSLPKISLGRKTSFYLYNNDTGQQVSSGWVLKAQVWTPGNP
ncbi:MAG: hypothetical protein ACXWT0_03975, partial [Methylobacter sp.]